MIGYPHFSPRKKLPTGAFSVIVTSGNAWLLCSIRGIFRHAIGHQSWIFKNETIPLCLRKLPAAPDTFALSSGSEEKTKSLSTLGFPGEVWGLFWEFLLLLGCHHELPLDWLFLFVWKLARPSPFSPASSQSQVCLPSYPLFSLSVLFCVTGGFSLQAASSGRQEGRGRESLQCFFASFSVSGCVSGYRLPLSVIPALDSPPAAPACSGRPGTWFSWTLRLLSCLSSLGMLVASCWKICGLH